MRGKDSAASYGRIIGRGGSREIRLNRRKILQSLEAAVVVSIIVFSKRDTTGRSVSMLMVVVTR